MLSVLCKSCCAHWKQNNVFNKAQHKSRTWGNSQTLEGPLPQPANSCFIINGFFSLFFKKFYRKKKWEEKELEGKNCYAKSSEVYDSHLSPSFCCLFPFFHLFLIPSFQSTLSFSFILLHSQCTFPSRGGAVLPVWEQVSASSNSPILHLALENLCQVQFLPYASIPIFCKMGITTVTSPQGYCAVELISTGSVLWDPGKKTVSNC